MKKKLLSMVMALALVLGCVTALGYKSVSAEPMSKLVDQEIKLNEWNYINLKYHEITTLKVELSADGTFKLDSNPKKSYSHAQLKDELGNPMGKKQNDNTEFVWKDLDKGIYYVEIWSDSSEARKAESIDVAYYASLEPTKDVVLDIGISLKKGKSLQLTKIFSPDNCNEDDMKWVPDDTKIATVSKSGKVKAKSKGETYIRLTCGPTIMAKIKVTVTAK